MVKQNTKFIWIYGAILFSFALILIVFAGLTQKESAHEEEKLSQSLSSLGRENSDLVIQRDNLQTQLDIAVQEKEQEATDKNAALLAYGGDVEVTKVLVQAYKEKSSGNAAKARETVSGLSTANMTDAQRYVYNTIIGG